MSLIDINKNSLPEQVQENKEKIAALESTTATKTYVDDQDAATLGLAKTYADGKDATTLQSAKDYADLAAAGALGDAKTYTDSGLALKQNTLTDSSVPDGTIDDAIGFDSDGNLVKGAAGSGGKTLVWSGNLTYSSGGDLPFSLTNGKHYEIYCSRDSLDATVATIGKCDATLYLYYLDCPANNNATIITASLVQSTSKFGRHTAISFTSATPSAAASLLHIREVYIYD